MKHVAQIKKMVEEEQIVEAYQALDSLLVLGPKNTEALKLCARLKEHEGRFEEAEQVWLRLAEIDPEDEETVEVFLRRHYEDREHFFFTDDLPSGERRFLAYPRGMINASAFGLIGSLVFLVVSKILESKPGLSQPTVLIGLFSILVLVPWAAIVVAYFRSMKFVAVGRDSIEVATRLRLHRYQWTNLARVQITYPTSYEKDGLALVLVPQDESEPVIEINLAEQTTAVRARSHFLREIRRVFHQIEHISEKPILAPGRKVVKI